MELGSRNVVRLKDPDKLFPVMGFRRRENARGAALECVKRKAFMVHVVEMSIADLDLPVVIMDEGV